VFGQVLNEKYLDLIEDVTSKDINAAVEHLLKSVPTMVVTGNSVNLIPSVADIQGRLR
jgi:predicted Zn-dependent peptidase